MARRPRPVHAPAAVDTGVMGRIPGMRSLGLLAVTLAACGGAHPDPDRAAYIEALRAEAPTAAAAACGRIQDPLLHGECALFAAAAVAGVVTGLGAGVRGTGRAARCRGPSRPASESDDAEGLPRRQCAPHTPEPGAAARCSRAALARVRRPCCSASVRAQVQSGPPRCCARRPAAPPARSRVRVGGPTARRRGTALRDPRRHKYLRVTLQRRETATPDGRPTAEAHSAAHSHTAPPPRGPVL